MQSIYYLDLTITKEGACIYETLNFYDVVTHIGGHRGKRHHGCRAGPHIFVARCGTKNGGPHSP